MQIEVLPALAGCRAGPRDLTFHFPSKGRILFSESSPAMIIKWSRRFPESASLLVFKLGIGSEWADSLWP